MKTKKRQLTPEEWHAKYDIQVKATLRLLNTNLFRIYSAMDPKQQMHMGRSLCKLLKPDEITAMHTKSINQLRSNQTYRFIYDVLRLNPYLLLTDAYDDSVVEYRCKNYARVRELRRKQQDKLVEYTAALQAPKNPALPFDPRGAQS